MGAKKGGKKDGKDADVYAYDKLGKDGPKDEKGPKDKKGKKDKGKPDKYTAGGVVNVTLTRYVATHLLNAVTIALGVVTDEKKKKKKKEKGKKTKGKKYDYEYAKDDKPGKPKTEKPGKDGKPGGKLGGIKKKLRR